MLFNDELPQQMQMPRNMLQQADFGSMRRGPVAKISPAIHEPFQGAVTAQKIKTAIEDAGLFLRNRQAPNGQITDGSYAQGGSTALATLALLAAGGHPASDPALEKALRWLLQLETNNTYVVAIRANVWEYALRKVPYERQYREALERDFKWLMGAMNEEGWRYSHSSTDWDNSCTQYGVLGSWAAARAGIKVPDKVWKKMSRHFQKYQNKDGGWGYVRGSGSTANMATAGLASMFLVFDMYHGRQAYSRKNPRTFSEGPAAKVLKSLKRGMQWLGKSQGSKSGAYYLYGIERAGVASGRKYFGGEDWFAKGALQALQAQAPDGSIPLGYSRTIGTALSSLFLLYGGAPVAFDKLQFRQDSDWNLNPRDLANLSRALWSAYERPLNWHVVSIKDPVEEFEAPILYLSGTRAARFNKKELQSLRSYVQRGGTLLAVPIDHSKAFQKSMLKLAKQLFPEHPLQALPKDHAAFTVLHQEWQQQPKLWGASNGARVFFFLSEADLSAEWQRNRVESDAFKLAMNLLFYSTDLGTLAGRFSAQTPEGEAAKARDQKINIARVRHGEGSDWDAAQHSWSKLSPYLLHSAGLLLKEVKPVKLSAIPKKVQLLHLTGRQALQLKSAEIKGLERYLDGGGTLLVDAWGGSESFSLSARELLKGFGKLETPVASEPFIRARFAGGVDLNQGLRFTLSARKALRRSGQPVDTHQLEIIKRKGRPAIFFSSYDLGAALSGVSIYKSKGYKPESARKLSAHLLAWLGS